MTDDQARLLAIDSPHLHTDGVWYMVGRITYFVEHPAEVTLFKLYTNFRGEPYWAKVREIKE